MKIAIIYDCIYPFVNGGGEKRIYEISKRLVSQGHEVHLFGVNWWNGPEIIENEGMILHGVCRKMELYTEGRRSISEAVIFATKLLPKLIKDNYDILDVTAFPYFSIFPTKLISMYKGIPMLITWHEIWGDYWYEYIGKLGFFGKIVESLVSKLGDENIVVSGMTRKGLESFGINNKNISLIPNGVDLKKINSIESWIEKCDIFFIGRLIKEKNVLILLEAISILRKDLPDIKCHIIGSGPEKENLVKYAVEKGLLGTVKFFDTLEYDEVIGRLKSSKILVLPSSREGFGIVVIEAFACGIPVITVKEKRNAASELITKETGLVINLSVEELSNSIYTLMMRNGLREKMSKSALAMVQIYDWDSIVKQLINLYKKHNESR